MTTLLDRPALRSPAPAPDVAVVSPLERQPVVVPLAPADLADLPRRLPGLVRDLRPGATVRVDVSAARPAPAELGLLLTTLWRRVGPSGSVTVTGTSDADRLAWTSLGLDPLAVRATVFGSYRP